MAEQYSSSDETVAQIDEYLKRFTMSDTPGTNIDTVGPPMESIGDTLLSESSTESTWHLSAYQHVQYPTSSRPAPYPSSYQHGQYPTSYQHEGYPTSSQDEGQIYAHDLSSYEDMPESPTESTWHPSAYQHVQYPTSSRPAPYPSSYQHGEYLTSSQSSPYPSAYQPGQYPTSSRPAPYPSSYQHGEYLTSSQSSPYPSAYQHGQYPTSYQHEGYPTSSQDEGQIYAHYTYNQGGMSGPSTESTPYMMASQGQGNMNRRSRYRGTRAGITVQRQRQNEYYRKRRIANNLAVMLERVFSRHHD